MYFIEHFLDLASRDGHPDYIRMMQRDIIRVVDAVAPDDGSGAANVKVVRKVSSAPTYPRLGLILTRRPQGPPRIAGQRISRRPGSDPD